MSLYDKILDDKIKKKKKKKNPSKASKMSLKSFHPTSNFGIVNQNLLGKPLLIPLTLSSLHPVLVLKK